MSQQTALSSRLRGSIALSALLALGLYLTGAPSALAATITWDNASGGNWSTAANWSPASVPAAGDVVLLPALPGPYVVTLDVDPVADEIHLATGSTLDLATYSLASAGQVYNAGAIQNFRGVFDGNRLHNLTDGLIESAPHDSIIVGDTLTNDGTIVVGPYPENALYFVGSSRIDGSGTIRIEQSARINCSLPRPQHDIWLTIGADQTLTGAGDVWVPIKNEGLLSQDNTVGPEMILHCYLYNYGTVRVSDGGWINVDCPLVKQFGGRIVGHDGTFSVVLPFHVGGSIDCINGGTLVADGGDLHLDLGGLWHGTVQQENGSGIVILDGYANPQYLRVDAGAELRVDGLLSASGDGTTLENNGTVRVRGTLQVGGSPGMNLSFFGDGQVVMEGGTLETPGGGLMTNVAGHTISGCGTITANIDNQGTINVDCTGYQSMTLKNGSITNRNRLDILRGKLVLHGNTLVNKGAISGENGVIKVEYGAKLDNRAGTVVAGPGNLFLGWKTPASTIEGGTLTATGGGMIQNVGQAVLSNVRLAEGTTLRTIAGATTRASGASFVNAGTNEIVGGGAFIVDSATDYDQTIGTTALAGGTLTVPGGLLVQGLLRGNGTIVGDVINDGDISPDASGPGIRIQGNYRQSQPARLRVGLAVDPNAQAARLAISGSATLDGIVAVTAPDGFAPGAGDAFSVMSFGSRVGQFSRIDAGPGLMVSPLYEAGAFSLLATPIVGGIDDPVLPTRLAFSSRAEAFRLELPQPADVDVRAYDVAGREVATLAHGAYAAGVHPLAFAGTRADLRRGIYFGRATIRSAAGTEVRTARVVILR